MNPRYVTLKVDFNDGYDYDVIDEDLKNERLSQLNQVEE